MSTGGAERVGGVDAEVEPAVHRLMRLRFVVPLALSLALAGSACAEELRGLWVDAFSPGCRTKEEIDRLIADARKANFNALFVQMRKSGDAYYQSRYDPWASDNRKRFDALRYLCEEAREGPLPLHVHAWLNTFAVGRSRGNPLHITERHPDWRSLSYRGESHDGEANKVDPGHPDAAEWTFRMYLDVLRNYGVDGIHFDFVRYGTTGGQANWGYSPTAVARFNRRFGRTGKPQPSDPLWKQWRREQVTALVRKVYSFAATVLPEAAVSAATIAWGEGPETLRWWTAESPAMNHVLQDWRSWMREGILDLNCPMTYFSERRRSANHQRWTRFAKVQRFGRHVAPAVGAWLNPAASTARQIRRIRKPGPGGSRANGMMFYSYAAVSSLASENRDRVFGWLATGPFAVPARPPSMPWKADARGSLLKGFVFSGPDLAPADGALVTLTGPVTRFARTDGSGFWAALGLPAGKFGIRVQMQGAPPASFAASVPGPASHVTFLRDPGAGVLRRALVLAGSDRLPGYMVVEDLGKTNERHVVRLRRDDELALQPGDIVSLAIGRTDTGRIAEARTPARLVDMQPLLTEGPDRPVNLGDPIPAARALPRWVRFAGVVEDHEGDWMTVTGGHGDARVRLWDVKRPGVEDDAVAIPRPPLGARVNLAGVAIATSDGVAIWPVRVEDVFYEVRAKQPVPKTRWLVAGASFVAILLVVWMAVRRRQRW